MMRGGYLFESLSSLIISALPLEGDDVQQCPLNRYLPLHISRLAEQYPEHMSAYHQHVYSLALIRKQDVRRKQNI